jgi:hypothetical protein
LEVSTVRGTGSGVIWGGRVRELRYPAIGGKSHADFDRSSVVNAGGSGRIGKGATLITAGNHVAAKVAGGSAERLVVHFGHELQGPEVVERIL